jgi:hypothetical protein
MPVTLAGDNKTTVGQKWPALRAEYSPPSRDRIQ